MNKDPVQRYQNGEELGSAIEAYFDNVIATTSRGPSGGSWVAITLLGLLCIALAVLAFWKPLPL